METVQQNGRFTLFSSKFPYNIYPILFGYTFATLLPVFCPFDDHHPESNTGLAIP